jgi:hypothetical protein
MHSNNSNIGQQILISRLIDDILVILCVINQPSSFLKCTRLLVSTWVVLGINIPSKLSDIYFDTRPSNGENSTGGNSACVS